MSIDIDLNKLQIGKVSISSNISGGNSVVYKGILDDGTLIAVKKYKGDKQRVKRMLFREFNAIDFLHKNGVSNIPELIEIRPDLDLLVFRWIEGLAPKSNNESMNAILEMCAALDEIYRTNSKFEYAIDAAFSGIAIVSQIENRIRKLQKFYPVDLIKDVTIQINKRLQIYNLDPRKNNVFCKSTFSFSDLGTHNMIHSQGKFTFIDFEFFGIDSANKLIGDFLLHPRNDFNEFEIARFVNLSQNIFEWKLEELKGLLPILALKWAIIAYGKTLRNLQAEHQNVVARKDILKSKGSRYLEYFDWLYLSENPEKLTSFCTFESMVKE